MKLCYLATPYSKYPAGIEAAFILAAAQCALLLKAGIPVFSPIAHTHPVAIHGDIDPYSHAVFLPADAPMMDAADVLVVVMAETWQESFGIAHEIEAFTKAGKRIVYMVPDEVPEALLHGLGVADEPAGPLTQEFDRAIAKINQARGAVYGHPADDFARANALKAPLADCRDPLVRHALEMIAVKIARLIETPDHLDSFIDIAGYARTAVMCLDRART